MVDVKCVEGYLRGSGVIKQDVQVGLASSKIEEKAVGKQMQGLVYKAAFMHTFCDAMILIQLLLA